MTMTREQLHTHGPDELATLRAECDKWHKAYDRVWEERMRFADRVIELEKENKELKEENVWHRCDIPNEDGLYNLPPENGEYIVEFVSKKSKSIVTSSDYDAEYNDWENEPFNCSARQWRELPKAPEVK